MKINSQVIVKYAIFGGMAWYFWQQSKQMSALGQSNGFRFNVDAEKLAASVTPWLAVNPMLRPAVERGITEAVKGFMGGLQHG
jgi:hypothetical protein